MSLYKQKGSEVWWASISLPDRPRLRQSTGELDRVKAQRVHDEIKAAAWAKPVAAGNTWGAAVLHWVKQEPRSDSELLSLAKFGRAYKDRPLSQVTRENIDAALSFCQTAGTYTRYRTMIAAILNLAKAEGWLAETPNLAVRRDKKKKARMWLTPEQWSVLFVKLPPHQRAMAKFSIETGLRQSNVLGLTWDRVDLARRLVWVEAADMKGDTALPVPLSDEAHELLKAKQGEHPQFVFTFRGKPISEIKTAFQRACVEAGVAGFTWHGFRHTWATWHVQNGTPLDVLQKLGGWSDLRMVMNYSHHSPGHLASFANNTKKKP